ncbi:hypothetical protein G6F57_018149 [Rhizopus arrhizus]|nr:hypothetical protein G6F57_018149 [Rhizopus arrhizus]
MRMVTQMAHERAARALRMVVLAAGETIVHQQRRAALQPAAHRGDPRLALQIDLRHVARQRRHACGNRRGQRDRGGAVFPDEAPAGIQRHAAFLHGAGSVPGEQRYGHCIQHFVGQHAARERIGQRIQPLHAIAERRQARRLAGAQVCGHFQDQVPGLVQPHRIQLAQHAFGQRAGARAEFQHGLRLRLTQHLGRLPGHRAGEQWRQLRRALPPSSGRTAASRRWP